MNMNMNTPSSLEQQPQVSQRVIEFWGTNLLAEYVNKSLLVQESQYEETLSMETVFELMFLLDIHKNQFGF
jgi:hypothetical protein